MKTLKQHITEAKEHEVHPHPSAAKIRSSIIKKYGGERTSNFGGSNPYSSYQTLNLHVPRHAELKKHLSKHPDWHPVTHNENTFESKHGAIVHVGGPHVQVVGHKKSKARTIPYYD